MSRRLRLLGVYLLAAVLAVPATIAWAGGEATSSSSATTTRKTATTTAKKPVARQPTAQEKFMIAGRKLYKEYCGKCHALKVANAAGFGGIGTEPGPSFNDVRANYRRSINAIVESIGGHETISKKMTWQEIQDVSRYLAIVTKKNVLPGTTAYG